jgi:hypothetical protein
VADVRVKRFRRIFRKLVSSVKLVTVIDNRNRLEVRITAFLLVDAGIAW